MKASTLVEVLHDLTQARIQVTFQKDFSGMLVVCYSDDEHHHVGVPHGTIEELTTHLVRELCRKREELTEERGS
jgi:hypothetical protein